MAGRKKNTERTVSQTDADITLECARRIAKQYKDSPFQQLSDDIYNFLIKEWLKNSDDKKKIILRSIGIDTNDIIKISQNNEIISPKTLGRWINGTSELGDLYINTICLYFYTQKKELFHELKQLYVLNNEKFIKSFNKILNNTEFLTAKCMNITADHIN